MQTTTCTHTWRTNTAQTEVPMEFVIGHECLGRLFQTVSSAPRRTTPTTQRPKFGLRHRTERDKTPIDGLDAKPSVANYPKSNVTSRQDRSQAQRHRKRLIIQETTTLCHMDSVSSALQNYVAVTTVSRKGRNVVSSLDKQRVDNLHARHVKHKVPYKQLA